MQCKLLQLATAGLCSVRQSFAMYKTMYADCPRAGCPRITHALHSSPYTVLHLSEVKLSIR
jgi:hypothetical protein